MLFEIVDCTAVLQRDFEWKVYSAFSGAKSAKTKSKKGQMQDAVVNLIKTVLLSAVIKIVWS